MMCKNVIVHLHDTLSYTLAYYLLSLTNQKHCVVSGMYLCIVYTGKRITKFTNICTTFVLKDFIVIQLKLVGTWFVITSIKGHIVYKSPTLYCFEVFKGLCLEHLRSDVCVLNAV